MLHTYNLDSTGAAAHAAAHAFDVTYRGYDDAGGLLSGGVGAARPSADAIFGGGFAAAVSGDLWGDARSGGWRGDGRTGGESQDP